MAEFDIVPPEPPRFFDKSKESKNVKVNDNKTKTDKIVDLKQDVKVEPKKKSLFSFFSGEKSVSEEDNEGELNLEKIREQYKIPPPKNKPDKIKPIKKKTSKENIEWTKYNHDKETSLKDDNLRWDVEEPVHLKQGVPIPQSNTFKSSDIAVKKKDSEVDVSKIPRKKMRLTPPKKSRRRPVDKAILEYFNKIESEQKRIKKELELIVKNPKKAIRKKYDNYLIHHNEKLIKSMKHLIVTIKSIEDIQFKKSVQADKKKFEKWIKGILELEKKAENQRNIILQKKIGELFDVYSKGLFNDLNDKRYELSNSKREADDLYKKAQNYELKMKNYHERLKKLRQDLEIKKKNIHDSIQEGINKNLAKKLKKERASIKSTEIKLKKLMDDYTSKSEKLLQEIKVFETEKKESLELIKQGKSLKMLKAQLEDKDSKLRKDIENLNIREKELTSNINQMEVKNSQLVKKSKFLNSEIKRLEQKENKLVEKEQELKLELKDFETRKKEFELREKELNEMESYLSRDHDKLKHLKHDLGIRDRKTAHKWQEVEDFANMIGDDLKSEEQIESKLKNVLDEFTFESKKLKKKEESFQRRKSDSKELLKQGTSLKRLKNKLEDKNSKLSKLDEELLQRETEANNKLHEAKKLVDNIRRKELDLVKAEKRVGVNFTHFLRDNSDEILKPAHPSEEIESFNKKISLCKEMLNNNEFEDAKKLYSNIRSDFFNAKLHSIDKEAIYNSLRELYDDIYLGMISLN